MIPTAPPPLDRTLVRELERALDRGAVVTEPDRLLVYESDGLTRYRSRPAAVVLPRDTAQCARAVRLLHAAGVPIVPRGAGTGLSGGAVAPEHGVVVGTARMNRILGLDPAARTARVQAGVVNADLTEAAAPFGLVYAPDPSSQSACTLGGNVAENSGGPHCLKYGVTSRYVTALTVVTAEGEAVELRTGGAGLDLVGLFVGSEGCFGLATEIELALVPRSEAVRTLLAAFPTPEAAGAAVSAIIADGLVPAALEIVDANTIRAVEDSIFAAGYPRDAGAALVAEFDGPDAGLDTEVDRARALCLEHGATDIRSAREESERAALWKGRKKAFGALGRLAPDLLVQDATVPRSRLPDVLRRIDEIARRHELAVASVFHAGDGNLHPNLLFDRRVPEQVERVERASAEIMRVCVAAGGTITGEHGVGLDKRHYMSLVHGEEELRTMAAVRAVFDPHGIWNPGKVLPDTVGAAPAPVGAKARRGPPPDPRSIRAVLERLGLAGLIDDDGAVRPRETTQVAALLRHATDAGWRVRVAGLQASAGAGAHDLVVHTDAFDGIVSHEPADLTATVEGGVSLADLQAHLARAGQWLPIDGPGLEQASVGGLVAAAPCSALGSAFGEVRDLVLGLTLVTGDGRTLRLGGSVVKNVAGFDLTRLVVGSRGRLGLVTRVVLRLHPRPAADRTVVVGFDDPQALVAATGRAIEVGAQGASIEVGYGGGGGGLLVRVLGSEAAVDHETWRLAGALGPAARIVDADEGRVLRETLRRGSGDGDWLPLLGEPSATGLARALDIGGRRGASALWALPERGRFDLEGRGGPAAPLDEHDRAPEAAGSTEMLARLEEGLRRVFDPGGVLAGGPA